MALIDFEAHSIHLKPFYPIRKGTTMSSQHYDSLIEAIENGMMENEKKKFFARMDWKIQEQIEIRKKLGCLINRPDKKVFVYDWIKFNAGKEHRDIDGYDVIDYTRVTGISNATKERMWHNHSHKPKINGQEIFDSLIVQFSKENQSFELVTDNNDISIEPIQDLTDKVMWCVIEQNQNCSNLLDSIRMFELNISNYNDSQKEVAQPILNFMYQIGMNTHSVDDMDVNDEAVKNAVHDQMNSPHSIYPYISNKILEILDKNMTNSVEKIIADLHEISCCATSPIMFSLTKALDDEVQAVAKGNTQDR